MDNENKNYLNLLTEAGHGIEGLLRVINFLGFDKFKKIYNGEMKKNDPDELNPFDILDTLNRME